MERGPAGEKGKRTKTNRLPAATLAHHRARAEGGDPTRLALDLGPILEACSSFYFSKKLQKLQALPNGVASSSGEKLGKLVFALKNEKHLSRCFPSFSPPLLFQLARSSARPRRPIPSPRRPSSRAPLPVPAAQSPRRHQSPPLLRGARPPPSNPSPRAARPRCSSPPRSSALPFRASSPPTRLLLPYGGGILLCAGSWGGRRWIWGRPRRRGRGGQWRLISPAARVAGGGAAGGQPGE